jgi:hypothetical protein
MRSVSSRCCAGFINVAKKHRWEVRKIKKRLVLGKYPVIETLSDSYQTRGKYNTISPIKQEIASINCFKTTKFSK